MSYTETFIQVAEDCPVTTAVVPTATGPKKSLHVLQYELLAAAPYSYTHEDLLFEVYVRHRSIPQHEVEMRGAEIRAELLQKSHPCLRASLLPKKYGWGVHYDAAGRIAIYARESNEYQQFTQTASGSVKQLKAMRNKRA
ncbi:MAG: DUF6157 family protein [Chloroflexota bacterium]|nr:DUF6157 family protein [Chloroflexota bacterium]PLS79835.1 MAG: hypothetical protein CYG59_11315 [Chloroflexota bacterium]